MHFLTCRTFTAALLFTGPAFNGHGMLQQQFPLADVHDSLLHEEIAVLGAYPELCELCSEAVLLDVRRVVIFFRP